MIVNFNHISVSYLVVPVRRASIKARIHTNKIHLHSNFCLFNRMFTQLTMRNLISQVLTILLLYIILIDNYWLHYRCFQP